MTSGKIGDERRAGLRSPDMPASDAGDGKLLESFLERRDEAAFTALVRRHGPMVHGVCRRVLRNHHDADDAFQATFLVLARKARSITKRSSVGSWLHGVAFRTALKARTRSTRRSAVVQTSPDFELEVERQAEVMNPQDPAADAAWREVRTILDEELSRLPEKYRAPMVLCYLEGNTNEKAAQHLGWTKGTVSGRLALAREWLRKRLSRRGVTLSAALFTALMSHSAAQAELPVPLILSTVKTGMTVGGGSAASATVVTLAEEVLKAMWLIKMKFAVVAFLATAAIATGVGVAAYQLRADEKINGLSFPRALANAVKARFPNAEITGLKKEIEAGKSAFEVTLTENGRVSDVMLTPEGKLFRIERQIAVNELPAAVVQSLAAKYPKADYRKIEEMLEVENETESLEAYQVLLIRADRQVREVQLSADGRILSEEKTTLQSEEG